jgi:hypothetical protein
MEAYPLPQHQQAVPPKTSLRRLRRRAAEDFAEFATGANDEERVAAEEEERIKNDALLDFLAEQDAEQPDRPAAEQPDRPAAATPPWRLPTPTPPWRLPNAAPISGQAHQSWGLPWLDEVEREEAEDVHTSWAIDTPAATWIRSVGMKTSSAPAEEKEKQQRIKGGHGWRSKRGGVGAGSIHARELRELREKAYAARNAEPLQL